MTKDLEFGIRELRNAVALLRKFGMDAAEIVREVEAAFVEPVRAGTMDPTIAEKELGTVKFYKRDKGYGFITTSRDDVFLHATSLAAIGLVDIRKYTRVAFKRANGPKGEKAIEIELL